MDRRTFGITSAALVLAPIPSKSFLFETESLYRWYDFNTKDKYLDLEFSDKKIDKDLTITGKIRCRNGENPWLTIPYIHHNHAPIRNNYESTRIEHTPQSLAELMRTGYGMIDARQLYLAKDHPIAYLFCGRDRVCISDLFGRFIVFYFNLKPDKPEIKTIKYLGFDKGFLKNHGIWGDNPIYNYHMLKIIFSQ